LFLKMILSPPPSSSLSWIDIDSQSDFSLQNFPFAVFSKTASDSSSRCCSAIGSFVVDLAALANEGIFDDGDGDGFFPDARNVFDSSSLNAFMSKPKFVWRRVRLMLIELFSKDGMDDRLSSNLELQEKVLIPLNEIILHLPATIGDYTDFYSSREHAVNVGTMFRGKENALGPNWLHLPVGYHGRASSVFVSGTDVVRPSGQLQTDPKDPKLGSYFGPCQKLDFELEMAFFVGGEPNIPGKAITMENANDYIFGFTLMNDWSGKSYAKTK
jgi:fumarylacetoacetase